MIVIHVPLQIMSATQKIVTHAVSVKSLISRPYYFHFGNQTLSYTSHTICLLYNKNFSLYHHCSWIDKPLQVVSTHGA